MVGGGMEGVIFLSFFNRKGGRARQIVLLLLSSESDCTGVGSSCGKGVKRVFLGACVLSLSFSCLFGAGEGGRTVCHLIVQANI